jgi:hypothetical protein
MQTYFIFCMFCLYCTVIEGWKVFQTKATTIDEKLQTVLRLVSLNKGMHRHY